MPRIVEPGHVIGNGEFLNLLDRPRILDRDRRVIRQRLQEEQFRVAKAVHVDVDQLNHPEHPMFGPQGNANNGLRLPLRHLVDPLGKAGISHDVGHDQALAMLGHPAGDPFPNFKPHILQCFRGVPHGNRKVELIQVFVDHQQRPGIRTEVLRHLLHNGLQNGIEIQRRGQGLGHAVKDVQFLKMPVATGAGGLTGHALRPRMREEVLELYAAPGNPGNQP